MQECTTWCTPWFTQRRCLQVAAANLRFGEGVTREVGMDFKNMNARKVSSAGGP